MEEIEKADLWLQIYRWSPNKDNLKAWVEAEERLKDKLDQLKG